MSAQDRGWGLGWPNCQWGEIVTLVRADGLRLPVNRRLADLTTMLLDLTEMSGYDVLPGQTWGFACRAISGTTVASNHSWGLADDINAPSNPYASADWHRRNARGTRPFGLAIVCDIPQAVVEMWEAHGYRWGGRYRTKPDPMHFEFMGTPREAAAITSRLRSFLAGEGQPAPPPPVPPTKPAPPAERTFDMQVRSPLRNGDEGGDVGTLQALLNGKAGQTLAVDRDFGDRTERAVVAFQTWWNGHDSRISIDGIVGDQTWGLLAI